MVYNQERKITEKPLTRFCPQPNCVSPSTHKLKASVVIWLSSARRVATNFAAIASGQITRTRAASREDKGYFKWKKNKNVNPCPGCGQDVEKIYGCSSVVCSRCRQRWCFNCGLATRQYGCPRCPNNYGAPALHQETWGDFSLHTFLLIVIGVPAFLIVLAILRVLGQH